MFPYIKTWPALSLRCLYLHKAVLTSQLRPGQPWHKLPPWYRSRSNSTTELPARVTWVPTAGRGHRTGPVDKTCEFAAHNNCRLLKIFPWDTKIQKHAPLREQKICNWGWLRFLPGLGEEKVYTFYFVLVNFLDISGLQNNRYVESSCIELETFKRVFNSEVLFRVPEDCCISTCVSKEWYLVSHLREAALHICI